MRIAAPDRLCRLWVLLSLLANGGCVARVITDDRQSTVGAEDDGAEDDGAEDDGAEDDGAEDDGAEDDGAEDDGAEDDGAEDDGPGGRCPAEPLNVEAFPAVFEGGPASSDQLFPPCVESNAAEHLFSFTAPNNAAYTFSTVGSNYDTVLFLLDGDCEGLLLDCNDDAAGETSSFVNATLVAGQRVTVVIDGFDDVGDWRLTIDEGGSCPEGDLPSETNFSVQGELFADDGDTVEPSCGGSGRDQTFAFSPPESGDYTFRLSSTNFDPLLAVFDETCGQERACNDDATDLNSRVEVSLQAGVPVVVVVESFGGQTGLYELSISRS